MTSSSLRLARTLKSWSRTDVIELLAERHVSGAHVRDFFDLADAVLDETNIADALTLVPRTGLVALATADPDLTFPHAEDPHTTLALLRRLALVAPDGDRPDVALSEVTAVVRRVCAEWSIDIDGASIDANSPLGGISNRGSVEPIDPQKTRAELERGFTLTSAIDELASAIAAKPAKRMTTGLLSAADTVRLGLTIEHTGLPITHAIALAHRADLIGLVDGWWMPSSHLPRWRDGDPAQRWVALVSAWRASLDPRVTQLLLERDNWGPPLVEFTRWMYPLDSQWIVDLVARATLEAAHLGLASHDTRSALAVEALAVEALTAGTADTAPNLETLRAHAMAALPAPVESVYVQNDLTIVAPGLLRPEAEALLRRICDVEHSGLASTFRLNARRLADAYALGLSANDVLAQLAALSATPLPQPVTYLIEDTAARFGSVRVRPWGGGALVTCRDEHLLDQLLVDAALATLAWHRESATAASTRRDPEATLELLVTERHPAMLEDDEGNVVRVAATPVLPIDARTPAVPAAHALADRLLASTATETGSISQIDDDSAWRERQVSLAIRDKSTVDVTFQMPDGSSRSMTIVPLSLSNGRLRARDATTDVERTLPMASIVALATPVA